MTRPSPNLSMTRGGPGPLFAHSRAKDPLSSHAAGDRHLPQAHSNRERIVQAMQGREPMTSKQIAILSGLDRHEAARRLPELVRQGRVKVHVFEGQDRENEYWIER